MTTLITPTEVRTLAFIDQNINTAKILTAYIEVAQESYLRPILGNDFYDEVLVNYSTVPYSTLVTQFKPALAYFVKYIALPEIMVQVTDKGALMAHTGSGNPVDSKARGDVRTVALQMGEKYAEIAKRWLESDAIYPLFTGYSKGENIKNRITRKGGLVLNYNKTGKYGTTS